ncbi:hypothetical protein [Candidatus Palauibacter sp.]|uniref:hypothetical protein n=1 Tax=Candidatus Palauibacter sp. TaxID=3101350 RepID=UPI003B5A634A
MPDLPTGPGVYIFVDAHGHPLYVGKSVNLRRRVRGYFYAGGPTNERLAEMLRIARGVEAHPTGSDLEARLVEAERILEQRPPYNKALKRRDAGWYLELRWNEPFPRLRVVRRPRRAGARYVGPFWSRRLPDRIRHLVGKIFRLRSCAEPVRPELDRSPCMQFDMGLCTAPCARRVGINDYRRQASSAGRLLVDREFAWDLMERLEGARDRASERLEFERAAEAQARLDWLEELEELRFALAPEAEPRSWLIVLPGVAATDRTLQPVARGQVLRRRRVAWVDGAWQEAVEDACYAVRVAELRAPSVLSPRETVPSAMVGRWLEEEIADGHAIDLTRLDTAAAIDRLQRIAS